MTKNLSKNTQKQWHQMPKILLFTCQRQNELESLKNQKFLCMSSNKNSKGIAVKRIKRNIYKKRGGLYAKIKPRQSCT